MAAFPAPSFTPAPTAKAAEWLQQFLQHRFSEFGPYEDAIVGTEHILHHSVLTPMLNVGLLTPLQIIDETLHHSRAHHIPLPSVEGFVRQVIGWRKVHQGRICIQRNRGTHNQLLEI